MDDEPLLAHKFYNINENLISAILEGYIYFSSPKNFNDPYDCRVNLNSSLSNAVGIANEDRKKLLEHYTGERLSRLMGLLESVGVACFSARLDNRLMWSHYAGNHAGVALTYQIPTSFILDNLGAMIGWNAVQYGDNVIRDAFSDLKINPDADDYKNYIEPIAIAALTTKSIPWQYEEEFRIISYAPGRRPIDRTWLRQVCFGMSTKPEHIALIKRLIDCAGYENIVYGRMERNDQHDFGFGVVDFTP